MKSLFRGVLPLAIAVQLTAGVMFVALQTSCSKDQLVASAQDVLDVTTDQVVIDALRSISPFAVAKLAAVIPSAKELVAAVKASDSLKAKDLVEALFPVINDIATQLTGNEKALAVLALANVGIHFLLNHLPDAAVKAAKARGGAAAAEAGTIQNYKAERVWGCDYRPKDQRCTVLAH